jgi:hypothetical protein
MHRPTTDREAEIKQILDRVQLTPERIRDLQHDISHEVVASGVIPQLIKDSIEFGV